MSIITVPSWVIPGTYLENLRFLENKTEIDGVELLFFIYDEEIKKMLNTEWKEILQYQGRFVFTAHLPGVLLGEHEELVERLAPLVRHFIAHPGPAETAAQQAKRINRWAAQFPLCRFLGENTNPGMLEALLSSLDERVGICMDTGHLLLEGKNPALWFNERRERIAEIHLHGLDREKAALDGRLPDHRPITAEAAWLAELRPLLENFNGVINLEVFSWKEVQESITALKSIKQKTEDNYGKH
ncbi:MAG: TIM barrel protein [Treponema sp.]|jgi:hypothetical protein|nr:TIM barrel protein [Treponema sp.]